MQTPRDLARSYGPHVGLLGLVHIVSFDFCPLCKGCGSLVLVFDQSETSAPCYLCHRTGRRTVQLNLS